MDGYSRPLLSGYGPAYGFQNTFIITKMSHRLNPFVEKSLHPSVCLVEATLSHLTGRGKYISRFTPLILVLTNN
ncbi:MAG TPA: hypothetical protein DCO83_10470 [Mucilaginibacter sp.]|jgi:hypothetical protein|nr:hypothetical protein [Mucilaginibacter sp.]